VVGCVHNPLLAVPLTLKGFVNAGHVAVRIDGRNTYVEKRARTALAWRGEWKCTLLRFIQAPWLLPERAALALMHERLARLMRAAPRLANSSAAVRSAAPCARLVAVPLDAEIGLRDWPGSYRGFARTRIALS
jgi:hypothetical protein